MKKLITLLLVLTGCVGTVSATSYTVYFKPNSSGVGDANWRQWNERYALYMFTKENDVTKAEGWTDFTQIGTTGVFSATMDASTYTSGMVICRMNGSAADNKWDNKWVQSADLNVPSSDVYYDKSGNSSAGGWTASSDGMSVTTPSSYSTESPVCVVAADKYVVNNNENWQSSSTANKMTYNNDFTYSLSVTEHFVHAGQWGCKIIKGGSWCGDPENDGKNFPVNITTSGNYTLTYTYHIVTGRVTVTPNMTAEATMEYYVHKYNGSTFDDGVAMIVTNGVASLTASPVSLTAEENNLQWKIEWKAKINDTQVATDWTHYDSGVDGRYVFTPIHTGNHTVTYFYNPYTKSWWAKAHYIADAYYYIGGSGEWTSDKSNPLTNDGNGNYSITINNKAGNTFAIAPSYAYTDNAVSNWGYVIHPDIDENNVDVEFVVKSGLTKEANCSNNWEVPTYADYITLTFTPATNTWSVTPYRTLTIGTAGYATWSNGEKYKVSDADNVYVVSASNSTSVTLTEKDADTVFPANDGIIVKGDNGDEVKFLAVASDADASDIGTNILSGTGNSSAEIAANCYVLWWDGTNASSVGFQKTTAGTLAAHKAYIPAGQGAPEFLGFSFGETTDLSEKVTVNSEKFATAPVYNLNGQRVMNPSKGLYIVNGRKVAIK